MSLERLLAETLHQADGYQPSPDLFARVERSIEEDAAHRRRMRSAVAGVIGAMLLVAGLLAVTVSRGKGGLLVVPAWSLELLTVGIQLAVMVTIGPSIRRFGKIYVRDAFRFNTETSARFLDLFDVAFYLFFTGWVLMGVELAEPHRMLVLEASVGDFVDRLATFLFVMGVAHALTLGVVPVVGLVFGSTVRRARRAEAGSGAPPVAAGAATADRVVKILVWAAAGLALVGGIVAFGLLATMGIVDG